MKSLAEVLAGCVDRREGLLRRGMSLHEQNTKGALIEPVIAALGWDVQDPFEVHREYQRLATDRPVDYALLVDNEPRLFVEAKRNDERLDDVRWINQTISYAAVAGVVWVALTNGSEWRIYNAHAPVPAEQKLFRAVGLESADAVEVLSLLSKRSVREGRLDRLWRASIADRRVREAVTLMLGDLLKSGPFQEELVSRTGDVQADDVRASLARLRLSVHFEEGREDESGSLAATPVEPPRATRNVHNAKLGELLDAGRLVAGAVLEARYMGRSVSAEVMPDGQIRYAGVLYRSVSGAGKAAKRDINPDLSASGAQVDGWDFWSAKDVLAGDVVPLSMIRARTANNRHQK